MSAVLERLAKENPARFGGVLAEHRRQWAAAGREWPASPAWWSGGSGRNVSGETLPPWSYVSMARLGGDVMRLVPHIPGDVDLIVGVARSGLVPAGLLSAALHRPLWSLDQVGGWLGHVGSGGRLIGSRSADRPRRILLVDDSAALGGAMRAASEKLAGRFPDVPVTRVVVYCHPRAVSFVDLFAVLYPGQHYFEWNWPNAGHGAACAYDFDGILCVDATPTEWTLEAVLKLQETVAPRFVPRRAVVPLICTGRGEESREVSEAWLHRQGVRWDRLVMRPDYIGHAAGDIADFKARVYGESRCELFAESDPWQAERIAALTGRPVLCPDAGRLFGPALEPPVPSVRAPVSVASGALELLNARVRRCPHRDPFDCTNAMCAKLGHRVTYDFCRKCPDLPPELQRA